MDGWAYGRFPTVSHLPRTYHPVVATGAAVVG